MKNEVERFFTVVGTLHFSFLSTLIVCRKQVRNYKCFTLLEYLEIKRVERNYCNIGLPLLLNYSSKSCCFKFAVIWQDTACRNQESSPEESDKCVSVSALCMHSASRRHTFSCG